MSGKSGLPRVLVVNTVLAGVVWLIWAVVWGARYFEVLAQDWRVAVTMVFGSLVGGGTSEGGGAIAFPVMTKVLAVPPDQARIFTFAIQSIGMTAASLSILLCRVPVERRVVFYGSAAGAVGVVLGVTLLAPLVPLPTVRALFTMLLVALAVALVVQLRQRGYRRNATIPVWTGRELLLVVVAGFAGGVVSGVVGVGENCVMFLLLVLLFRVSEKVATPTTVVMMTVVSITAFLTHVFVTRDFTGPVVGYWVAAAPIVAVGAPLGAWICTNLTPLTIRGVLFVLIGAELASTVVLVPFTPGMVMASAITLVLVTGLCLLLVRQDRYATLPATPNERVPAGAVGGSVP
ncbi:TSUP family transporter [Streptomyces sp. NBC_01433]|uniref:TSUP family transporter n=1 Tax=Streptomyces sp. NBC_01433 TaxID=2903864 RepID=UPI0022586540|nr:TSUP family transporter [Streptomyces sp. NBC_01433]MCX4678992.1 TSUP family transporter [Streptomyces sp. NBC_01433]